MRIERNEGGLWSRQIVCSLLMLLLGGDLLINSLQTVLHRLDRDLL